jgi:hypothetical protein
MAISLLSRLDKSRLRVLCGRIECGARLADIREQEEGRVVIFPPGWTSDRRGVYRLTNRARRQIARGRPPNYRRAPATTHYFGPDGTPTRAVYAPTPRAYPAQAQCPMCGFIQLLDAARLDVVVEPRVLYPQGEGEFVDHWHDARYIDWAMRHEPHKVDIDPRLDHEIDTYIELYGDQQREAAALERWMRE